MLIHIYEAIYWATKLNYGKGRFYAQDQLNYG